MTTKANACDRPMTAAEESRRRKGAGAQPVLFITKPQLSKALGVEPGTIDDWVAEGSFPPPWLRPGKATALWRRDHFDLYVERRAWPKEAFHIAGGAS